MATLYLFWCEVDGEDQSDGNKDCKDDGSDDDDPQSFVLIGQPGDERPPP